MAAGFSVYKTLLSDRRARAFSGAGLIARMPISMTGLGIVLMISISTGSFGRAGLVTAAATVTSALAAPLWGRMIDRVGQARVLRLTAVTHGVSLSLLVVTVATNLPLPVTMITALGVGLGNSVAGSSVRARWSHRLDRHPELSDPDKKRQLNTAYAFEAVLDEVVFIFGPVLVTFLATSITPALGLASCVVLGLTGGLALAAQRSTQPPILTVAERAEKRAPLNGRVLVPVVFASAALGALFGGMEVVIVAYATEANILSWAGALAMAWATGSLIAGVITGTIHWKAPPTRRFRISALLLGLSILPLPFITHPVLIAVVLVLSGLAIAPSLIAAVAVTQSSVPAGRLTEALGWTSMGMSAGVAAGAAGLGQIIDHWGAQAGFWGAVTTGGIVIISALCVRARRPAAVEMSPSTEPQRTPVR